MDINEAHKFLFEAKAEIHRLLDELHEANPVAADMERLAYISKQVTPDFMDRVAKALNVAEISGKDFFK